MTLEPHGNGWIAKDKGEVSLPSHRNRQRRREVFTAGAPPIKVVEAYNWLRTHGPLSAEDMEKAGYRNALDILHRFELVCRDEERSFIAEEHHFRDTAEAVWNAAKEEETLSDVIEYLMDSPARRGIELARYLNAKYQANWSPASEMRVGNALLSWGKWIMLGTTRNMVPPPPGRRPQKDEGGQDQYPLFGSDLP